MDMQQGIAGMAVEAAAMVVVMAVVMASIVCSSLKRPREEDDEPICYGPRLAPTLSSISP